MLIAIDDRSPRNWQTLGRKHEPGRPEILTRRQPQGVGVYRAINGLNRDDQDRARTSSPLKPGSDLVINPTAERVPEALVRGYASR